MPAKQPHAADEFEAAFEQGLDILGMCDLKTSRVIAPGEIHPAAEAVARRKTAIVRGRAKAKNAGRKRPVCLPGKTACVTLTRPG